MGKKGQIELIAIIGIIVVVVIVAVLAVQTNLLGQPALTGETRLVKDSVENFIRAGAYEQIKTMGLQGGYLTVGASSVKFLGRDVPYWQKNGVVSVPDLSINLVQGIESYLRANKAALETSLAGKSVTIGEPQVSASVLANKIDFIVSMPTRVGDASLPQPYVVSVPTKLGEIYEFSKSFVTVNNEKRFFEYFTLSSIMMTPLDNGVQTVPTMIFLLQCGDYVFKTWWDIQPEALNVVESTLANTYMPGKAPKDTMKTSGSPKYTLTPLNGKRYEDIDASFFLPDDFEFTRMDFDFDPNPIDITAEPVPMTGVCHSEPVNVNYYMQYPVVVRINDPLTNNAFQFAFDVAIKDNAPAEWLSGGAGVSGYGTTERELMCMNPACTMKLAVKDSKGSPVPYASATFMNCPVGTADGNGVLQADVPCGIGNLEVYKQRFDVYSELKSSDGLADIQVTMTKAPVINLRLYEVTIDDTGCGDGIGQTCEYLVKPGAIRLIDNELRNGAAQVTVYSPAKAKAYDFYYATSGGRMAGVPAGVNHLSAVLYNTGATIPVVTGLMAANLTITEDMDGKTLNVYIPYFPTISASADIETAKSAVILGNILRLCGIGPVSESEASIDKTCVLSYDQAMIV